MLAIRLRLRDPAPVNPANRRDNVELQGIVDTFSAAAPEQVEILGYIADTSSIPDIAFTQNDGSYLGRTGFYNELAATPVVLVDLNGTLNTATSVVTWDAAEIEND